MSPKHVPASSQDQSTAQPPTVSGYYMDPKLKPSSFFKSVRAANIKLFQRQDIDSAKALLAERDSDFSRTLALGLSNRVPEAVERWMMEAAKHTVRELEPAVIAEESISGETILERIIRALADPLRSKSKVSRLRAHNVLRMGLLWLTRERSLDPLQGLYALADLSKQTSKESIRAQGQKILLQAKPGQWKALSAVARLSSDAVQRADRATSEATQARDRLQGRINEIEKALEVKQEKLDELSSEVEHLRSELAAGKIALKEEQKLRELDLAQAAGRTRHLLTGRLTLLLSDARVALDFEPPQIEAARQRLDAAKETIEQEVNSYE